MAVKLASVEPVDKEPKDGGVMLWQFDDAVRGLSESTVVGCLEERVLTDQALMDTESLTIRTNKDCHYLVEGEARYS